MSDIQASPDVVLSNSSQPEVTAADVMEKASSTSGAAAVEHAQANPDAAGAGETPASARSSEALIQPTAPSAGGGDAKSAAPNAMVDVQVKRQQWIAAQEEDPFCRMVKHYIQSRTLPTKSDGDFVYLLNHGDKFLFSEGLIKHMVTTEVAGYLHTAFVPVVPATLTVQVATEFHTSMAEGGHMSIEKTLSKLRQRFWWSTMHRDVANVINGCVTCQTVGKAALRKTKTGGSVTAAEPFEFIAMDLLALPESLTGNKYAMVVMDYFSRYAVVVATRQNSDDSGQRVAGACYP
jgi:hypothetical protein